MGFNLSSFGSGIADGVTTAYEAKADRRKEAVSSKRSLMFNATEAIYNNALDVKKSNDKIKNEDKKYISMVKSMDPTISTDNMNKLLSLSVDDRSRAQEEFTYRASQSESNVSSFGDFMSYVNDASDLSNPDKIDKNIESSMMTATETPKAYYDKTGLVSDESVNNMYSEVSGVLAEVHGMSVAQANAITKQGIYSVQHPPIKINWSKDIKVERGIQEELAKASIYSDNQLEDQALAIINKQVTLTGTAIDKLRENFSTNYMVDETDKDGTLTGNKVKAPAITASLDPDFESNFRSSPAYLKYAKESIAPYIMSMETDPDANTANAMTYINGTFPGLYGGTITTSTLTEDEFAAIVPTKIYYVDNKGAEESEEEGFIKTGAELLGAREGASTPEVVTSTVVAADDVEGNAAMDEAEQDIIKAEQNLAVAIETGADASTIKLLEEAIVSREDALVRQERDDKYSDSREARIEKAASSKPVFTATSTSHSVNAESLDIAIAEGDEGKAQQIVDNLTQLLSREGLSKDRSDKLASVRGDAQRAVRNISRAELYDERTAPLESLRDRALKAREAGASREDVIAIIKDINSYVETTTNDEQLMELDGLKSGLNTLL